MHPDCQLKKKAQKRSWNLMERHYSCYKERSKKERYRSLVKQMKKGTFYLKHSEERRIPWAGRRHQNHRRNPGTFVMNLGFCNSYWRFKVAISRWNSWCAKKRPDQVKRYWLKMNTQRVIKRRPEERSNWRLYCHAPLKKKTSDSQKASGQKAGIPSRRIWKKNPEEWDTL